MPTSPSSRSRCAMPCGAQRRALLGRHHARRARRRHGRLGHPQHRRQPRRRHRDSDRRLLAEHHAWNVVFLIGTVLAVASGAAWLLVDPTAPRAPEPLLRPPTRRRRANRASKVPAPRPRPLDRQARRVPSRVRRSRLPPRSARALRCGPASSRWRARCRCCPPGRCDRRRRRPRSSAHAQLQPIARVRRLRP